MNAGWMLASSMTIALCGYALHADEWRDRFDINKADLLPTGNNPFITMQPGRVLTLRKGIDTLTGRRLCGPRSAANA